MGVTIMTALLFWAASSFVEYKIVKNVPGVKPLFDNPVLGIVISIAIGTIVAYVVGIPTGIGAALGQVMGLATNQSTYAFFDTCHNVNKFRRRNMGIVHAKVASAKAAYYRHERTVKEAAQGVKAGLSVIGALIIAILWIIGAPLRLYRWLEGRRKAIA